MYVTTERSQPWWALVIRGIAAIVFGLGALFWPGVSLLVLVILYGAYAIVDGVAALVGAFQAAERHRRWWPLVLEGIVGILAGLIAFVWPGITAIVLVWIIGAWAIIQGCLEIAAGLRFASWVLTIAGILSVIFGMILLVFPGAGALSLAWLMGAYALVFGVLLLVHGFGLRTHSGHAAV